MDFGWNDSYAEPIVLVYRRKGERIEDPKFRGPVYVLDRTGRNLVGNLVARKELPNGIERLDLTRVPVIGIGGKRSKQPARVQDFLSQNPGFEGAFLLYPGSGNLDLGQGMLFVTSREILAGKRIFGGRPETQLVNERWLPDGRWVADRAEVLHGKTIKIVESEVEQIPGAEAISRMLTNWNCPFEHRLVPEMKRIISELSDLEDRRALTEGGWKSMITLVYEKLLAKLQEAAGVQKVADIPADLTLTAGEVAPDLVARAETLGAIEIPGVGRRWAERAEGEIYNPTTLISIVRLTPGEIRQVESWPFTRVYPWPMGLEYTRGQFNWGTPLYRVLELPETERWAKLKLGLAARWFEVQRGKNYPRNQRTTDPREADLDPLPQPVVWGTDLLTGESLVSYPALKKQEGEMGFWWEIWWYDSVELATDLDAENRPETESFMRSRHLKERLTAGASVTPFPHPLPERPEGIYDYQLPLAERRRSVTAHESEIREFVAALEEAPQWPYLPAEFANKVKGLAEAGNYITLEGFTPRLRDEWNRAEAMRLLQGTGEILVNWGGSFRVMGATHQAQFWVIGPDGTERHPDEVEYRKRYTSEGYKLWHVVGPEELAISWSKANTAAAHKFVVNKLPAGGGCTFKQLDTVERIEREIEKRFEGTRGMSGDPSPSVGKGWGLKHQSNPVPGIDPAPSGSGPVEMTEDLANQLAQAMGGRVRKSQKGDVGK